MGEPTLDIDQKVFLHDLEVCWGIARGALSDLATPELAFELLARGVADLDPKEQKEAARDLQTAVDESVRIFGVSRGRAPTAFLAVFDGLFGGEEDDEDEEEREEEGGGER